MTPAEFRQRLRGLNMTLNQFALRTGVHPATVSGWGSARSGRQVQPFPAWVAELLTAWEHLRDQA